VLARLRKALLLLATSAALLCCLHSDAALAERATRCIVRAELTGVVNRGTATFLHDARRRAERLECEMLLVALDTPGGDIESTRAIVGSFLDARVPVVVYVSPAGARAGSAGALLTMAAHVAVMTPGTNIGAAHPVSGMGKDPEAEGGEHLAEKIENDVAALARAVARERGRSVAWAESAVRESVSATAHEALEQGVIDHIVSNEKELLRLLDGARANMAGGRLSDPFELRDVVTHHAEMTLQQRAQTFLGNPRIAYLLLMIGVLGLVLEINNPGLIAPGAVGIIALLLAAVGLNLLPVNVGGLLLIVLAVGLWVAELYVTSFGLLTLGGVALLVLGSMLLIDQQAPGFFAEPEVAISWTLSLPIGMVMALVSGAVVYRVARDRKRPSVTGAEALVGVEATTLTQVGPDRGTVRMRGERWQAYASGEIEPARRVRVRAVDGLRLHVESIDGP
jgi:membrane-bound serine protease (ClpP class)